MQDDREEEEDDQRTRYMRGVSLAIYLSTYCPEEVLTHTTSYRKEQERKQVKHKREAMENVMQSSGYG